MTRRYDLLVLDYGGVCTMSQGELANRTAPMSLADAERVQCLPVVLAAQAAGITVAVLSNEIDRSWAEQSPVLAQVDHVLPCADNGIMKPDRRAYQRVLLITGCTADRALFVDDDADNVRGAQGAGLATLLFDTSDPAASWAQIEQSIKQ